jgi:predicted transcriptional regulator
MVSVIKLATVLQGYTIEEQRSVTDLLWAKRLTVRDIYKEIFYVYGGKCLSRKTVHNWIEKLSQGRSEVADDARPGAEVAETTVKTLLC